MPLNKISFICFIFYFSNLNSAELTWISNINSVTVGDEFYLTISTNTGGEVLNAYDLELEYPENFCEFLEIDESKMETDFRSPLSLFDNTLGLIKVNDLDVYGFTGTLDLLVLRFRVKENSLNKGVFNLKVKSYTNLKEIDLLKKTNTLEIEQISPSLFGSTIFPLKIFKNSQAVIHITATNHPLPIFIDYQWFLDSKKLIGENDRLTYEEALNPENFKIDLSTHSNIQKGQVLSCNLTPIRNAYSFSSTLPELTIANSAPSVRAENDKSASIGHLVTLSSNAYDLDEDPLSYQWTNLSQSNLNMFNENTHTLSVNVNESGRYIFRVVVSDGSESDFDDIALNIEPAFLDETPADEESKDDNLTEDQPLTTSDNTIDQLKNLDLENQSSRDQAIELSFNLSQKELDESERATFFDTVQQLVSGKHVSSLSKDQKSMILSSLDQTIDEQDPNLSDDDFDQVFSAVNSLVTLGDLEITQASKSVEILDEIIQSQVSKNRDLNDHMKTSIDETIDALFSEITKKLDDTQEVIELDYEHIDLIVAKVDLNQNQTLSQGNLNMGYQMSIPAGLLEETVQVKIVRQSFNPYANANQEVPLGDVVSFELFNIDDTEINAFDNSITLTIPYNLSNTLDGFTFIPKYFDTQTMNWSEAGISNIFVDEENGTIQFEVNHLTDFASFREEVSNTTSVIDSTETTTTVTSGSSGGGGGGGGGGCLLSWNKGLK